jgi:hypothetical protein
MIRAQDTLRSRFAKKLRVLPLPEILTTDTAYFVASIHAEIMKPIIAVIASA